jgi:hypothetical protein
MRKGATVEFIEYQLVRIARYLKTLAEGVTEMGEGQDALDAAIANLSSVADGIKSSIDQVITVVNALVVKLQSQPNAPDFTTEIQTLQSISDTLSPEKIAADAAAASGDAALGVPVPGSGEAPPTPPPTGQ